MCQEKQLLVLGMDRTLMYAGALPLAREPDFKLLDYFAYRRPHLHSFLREAFARFTVGIWSAAPPNYTRMALRELLPAEAEPLFVWDATRCSDEYDPDSCSCVSIRRLRKLKTFGYDLSRIVLIDDRQECMHLNFSNMVPIRPYFGAPEDDELELLSLFLPALDGVPDVRLAPKAYWHKMLPQRRLSRPPVLYPVVDRIPAPVGANATGPVPRLTVLSGA